jgi:hypothetical protein
LIEPPSNVVHAKHTFLIISSKNTLQKNYLHSNFHRPVLKIGWLGGAMGMEWGRDFEIGAL